MFIRPDPLRSAEVADFLQSHLDDLQHTAPSESQHALDLASLRDSPDIQVWCAWSEHAQLLASGAIQQLEPPHGELKSMRTAPAERGRGIAAAMLQYLIDQARQRGYETLSLETGSMAYFAPARRLYARFGFVECGPFASYCTDPYSVFMRLSL